MLNDQEAHEHVKNGLEKTYNFEFEAAKNFYHWLKVNYPEHPAYNFLMASNLYWEMFYYDNYKDQADDYFSYLNKALEQTQKYIDANAKDVEGIFFKMAIESSMALYYAEREENMKTITHAKKAYSAMKEGFSLKEKFVDFYFSTGLYNYFVVQYPETHPVYKPFMFFFAKGDKEKGIEQLKYSSEHGIFSSTESLHYLANIYLRYENNPENAVIYSEKLVKKYPDNFYFMTRHLEGLIATGQYKEAEPFAYKLYKTGKKPFIMRSFVFYGMLYEKHYKNMEEAMTYYNAALRHAKELTQPTQDWQCYIRAGMARICHQRGEIQKAVEHYEYVYDETSYTSLKAEAKDYLDKYD